MSKNGGSAKTPKNSAHKIRLIGVDGINASPQLAQIIHPDIASMRRREQALRLKALAFDKHREGVVVTDTSFNIQLVNEAFTKLTGYTQEDVCDQPLSMLDTGKNDGKTARKIFHVVRDTGQWKGDIWYRRKNGDICAEWATIESVFDDDGKLSHYVACFADISERNLDREQLNYMAQYDMLTGLPNRTLFRDRLRFAMSRSQREKRLMALMFLDLDRFKEINEALGHDAGDSVLRQVTGRLKAVLRDTDTIARLGSDEFMMIMERLSSSDEIARVADKVVETFCDPLVVHGKELFVTASVGVATYPGHGDTEEALIKAVELAIHDARQEGGNGYQFYSCESHAKTPARLTMESELRHALGRNELSVVYQPRIDLLTGCVTAVEALLRWNNDDLGNVPPISFIPVAEDTGLILPIGDWVMREACKQCRHWSDAGHAIKVAVNLSARQFKHKSLLLATASAIRDSGIDPRLLELEITESMLMHHTENSVDTLMQLSEMGVEIAIDDFGTGYSSLAYLKSFPVHALKIDQSFIREITHEAEDAAIVRAVNSLARSLKLKVIAEGVETEAQLEFLKKLKCDEYQGFLFSKPVSADQISRTLAAASAR